MTTTISYKLNSILPGHDLAMPFFGYESSKEPCRASKPIIRLDS